MLPVGSAIISEDLSAEGLAKAEGAFQDSLAACRASLDQI
jgi:hypothetical protein